MYLGSKNVKPKSEQDNMLMQRALVKFGCCVISPNIRKHFVWRKFNSIFLRKR